MEIKNIKESIMYRGFLKKDKFFRIKLKRINKENLTSLDFFKLKTCKTKKCLFELLMEMNLEEREILLFYTRNCFIHDMFTRTYKIRQILFPKREKILNCIENPKNLLMNCKFDKDLIRYFITGFLSFFVRHEYKLRQLSRRRA